MSKYGILYAYESSSNCKLSILEGTSALGFNLDKQIKDKFDDVLSQLRAVVFMHVTSEHLVNWINENYSTYYINKVPVGYGRGYQWHILLKNELSKMKAYLRNE